MYGSIVRQSAHDEVCKIGPAKRLNPKLSPWPVHDDYHTYKGYETANQVKFVRSYLVNLPSPKNGKNYEYATIGSVDPAKICRLKGWYNPIDNQHDCSG